MIHLHKLNGDSFVLNAGHIEVIDATPDTVITLANGKKYIVRESVEEVISLAKAYKREIYCSFR